MSNHSLYFSTGRLLLAAGLVCALAVPAFAGDGAGKSDAAKSDGSSAATAAPATAATPAQPKPDREKKIYANEDLEAMARNYGASTVGNPAPANSLAPQRPTTRQTRAAQTARVRQLPPDQDPVRYAQEYASLTAQINDIDAQVQRLRNFRASDAAPGSDTPNLNVGLNLYAPADGITTDAQIQQLLQRRATLEAQASELENRAQADRIAPGVFRNASEIALSAENAAPLTEQQRLAAARDTLLGLQSDLAAMSDTEAAMHQEAAVQNFTIAPETKFGGNMTSNYLKQLSVQQAAVQQQISAVEDTARQEGVPLGSLP